jgi:hypothetical protein
MSSTKTTTTPETAIIVVIFTAATLVVGGTFAATTSTPAAFAYKKDNGNGNGNTNTPQINKQHGIQSGFDNSFDQDLRNLICTHPSATCSTEGSEGVSGSSAGTQGEPQRSEALKGDTGLPAVSGLPGLNLMGQK